MMQRLKGKVDRAIHANTSEQKQHALVPIASQVLSHHDNCNLFFPLQCIIALVPGVQAGKYCVELALAQLCKLSFQVGVGTSPHAKEEGRPVAYANA